MDSLFPKLALYQAELRPDAAEPMASALGLQLLRHACDAAGPAAARSLMVSHQM